MNGFELAATILVVGLVVYLFWALLFPEDLS
ncbi:K(+)-transporting ATPase subunit F [Roseateles saccharophilus]|uniref:K+-transporting ATPase KdpF subunit n=1 Tax=Roseateles saccharophilus TaxID=304 RepID=A0A4R3VIW7_ROSSA|nr:K(+)-transporting ATPase subunit F [Roseateles saccharophilus]MDG0834560.1 K(+)-transporting ATPase subunit F [Roseateles saccharophilus]TCV03748.1 K+-transporting ATPase KdpF subunit [Roseateles saccharophilus]